MLRRRTSLGGVCLATLAAALSAASASPSSKIIGGSPIQIQAAPWTVYISQHAASGSYLCTGSIVDPSHILTAAHCVYDDGGALATPSQLSVKAGVSNFTTPSASDLEQDRAVSAVRVPPSYSWTGQVEPDDIAVLTLATPLDVSGPAVQTVALPATNAPFPSGAAVGVAGFGKQTPSSTASGPLAWMTATVDPQGACSSSAAAGLIDDNAIVLCASSPTSSVCNGDSGSGLVTDASPRTLIAVTDGASSGCEPGSHGSFAYLGAPELLSFVQGSDNPPVAPRQTAQTTVELDWNPPLVVGNTARCSTGGWGGGATFLYSFLDTSTGRVLQTSAHSTFVIPAADAGSTLQCRVAASNPGGTELAETSSSFPVQKSPSIRVGPIAPILGTRGKEVTVVVPLHSPGGLYGKFGVCATPPAPVGGRVCSSQQDGDGHPGSFVFRLSFTIRAGSPLVATHVAVDVTAGLATAQAKAPLRITSG